MFCLLRQLVLWLEAAEDAFGHCTICGHSPEDVTTQETAEVSRVDVKTVPRSGTYLMGGQNVITLKSEKHYAENHQ